MALMWGRDFCWKDLFLEYVCMCVCDVHGRDGVVKLRVSTCSADDDGSTLRCVN